MGWRLRSRFSKNKLRTLEDSYPVIRKWNKNSWSFKLLRRYLPRKS
jgi:hypothetical protein